MVEGVGLRAQGVGCCFAGLGYRVKVLWFMVYGLWFRLQGLDRAWELVNHLVREDRSPSQRKIFKGFLSRGIDYSASSL